MGVDQMASQEQMAMVAECRASGKTAKAWCEAKGINYRQYLYWASYVNKTQRAPQPQWAEVTMVKGEPVPDEILLKCGKWTICIGTGFNRTLLADILKVVDAVC